MYSRLINYSLALNKFTLISKCFVDGTQLVEQVAYKLLVDVNFWPNGKLANGFNVVCVLPNRDLSIF